MNSQEDSDALRIVLKRFSTHKLCVYFDHNEWSVWLDTDVGLRDGVCLSVAYAENDAITEAHNVLRRAADYLYEVLLKDSRPQPFAPASHRSNGAD